MSEETSEVDKKKEEIDSSTSDPDFGTKLVTFIRDVASIIATVIIYFGFSGIILYMCKLAQANILPNDANCFPYTNSKPELQPTTANLFTTFTDPAMSMKLKLEPTEQNMDNFFLKLLRNYKESPDSNFLANYFIAIVEGIFQSSYGTISTVFSLLNQAPEMVIVLLGPIIGLLLFMGLFIINGIYGIYLWFSSMSWFFKTNANKSGEGKPKWEDVTMLGLMNYSISVILTIVFVVLFFSGLGGFTAFITPIIICFIFLSVFGYKSELAGVQSGAFGVIKNLYKNYKITLMTLVTFMVIMSAFKNLGTTEGVFAVLVACLIYGGVISINIFYPPKMDHLSPVVSNEQTVKKCVKIADGSKKMFGFFGGGKSLVKELKKIGKQMA